MKVLLSSLLLIIIGTNAYSKNIDNTTSTTGCLKADNAGYVTGVFTSNGIPLINLLVTEADGTSNTIAVSPEDTFSANGKSLITSLAVYGMVSGIPVDIHCSGNKILSMYVIADKIYLNTP